MYCSKPIYLKPFQSTQGGGILDGDNSTNTTRVAKTCKSITSTLILGSRRLALFTNKSLNKSNYYKIYSINKIIQFSLFFVIQ